MATEALSLTGGALSAGISAPQLVARARKIQDVMEALMVEGVHYGKIPGTPKPSLWQPGAEKLMLAFELAPDLEIEDLSGYDLVRYRVTVRVRHVPTGAIVGSGVGECSSDEEKYRWRKAVCAEEWEEAPEDRRRKKWKKGERGTYQEIQVRTEPRDVANTILKMAKKRGLVDGAKSTTGASDIFDQDIEDLPEGESGNSDQPAQRVATPRAKSAAKDAPKESPAGAGSTSGDAGRAAPRGIDANIPAEAWQEAKTHFHKNGMISERQQSRLFAIAKGKGWRFDDVAALLSEHLGVGTRDVEGKNVFDLPHGLPYDKVVGIFEGFGPAS